MLTLRKIVRTGLVTLLAAVPVFADAVPVDGSWHEFQFGLAGTFAFSCGGAGCFPTIDPIAEQTSAPPWTFAGPAIVTLTDLFERGDRFELFDNAAPVGFTSAPVNDGTVTCPPAGFGDDILACLADPTYSHGSFALGGGGHSLTIEVTQNNVNTDFGAAVFQVAAVPEPHYVTFLIASAACMFVARKRMRRKS